MDKTISLPISELNEGADCLVDQLNSIDIKNLLIDIEFNDESEDLIDWQLIKSGELCSLNDLEFLQISTEEVVLCSATEDNGTSRFLVNSKVDYVSSVGDSHMMMVPVR